VPLSDHIRTLLRDHDCVIIPDFGGLIADYAPARIHPVRHTLAPPAKRVAFNQSLTRNDGLLVDALSQRLNLSTAQARQMVREAVARMQQELESGRRVELSGIGVFQPAAGHGLEFEYTGGDNLLSASFGLPELVSRPVRATDALNSRDRQPAPMLAAGRARRTARIVWGSVITVLVGLVLLANYLIADQAGYLPEALRLPDLVPAAQTSSSAPVVEQQAALAPAESFAAGRPTEKAVAAPGGPVKPAAKAPVEGGQSPAKAKEGKTAKPAGKAPGWEKARATNAVPVAESATIKTKTGRYYVVAGSYTSLVNAEKGRQALLRLGHPARVILPAAGSRQFKLSVADFADRTSADRQASLLRKRMGTSLWVLNY
jgi:hypothetical protein